VRTIVIASIESWFESVFEGRRARYMIKDVIDELVDDVGPGAFWLMYMPWSPVGNTILA
jgi:hypothetical protein